ncbi:MAG: crossover junction endodeoxyribonuclease RuvC [Sediminibacterium sp.]|jgi:crossover junction endodeoxyribonuclease RuvC|nr:crossover junction endodeoxyribonuclease RuvC [Hydrotalea sp.]MCU0337246.1 crossover junction endodeoxyribonuclease RuvC [Sediminibacterium sp.]
MKQETIIMGIDPGSQLMGYALLRISSKGPALINMNVLKLTGEKDIYVRLQRIHSCVSELIQQYQPHTFAIEAPFFGKNVQSMLKLGRAQGVAIAAAMHYGIPVTEYSPRKVKQSITGNGNSDKEQVWKMLQQILGIQGAKASYDATDALAIALCHYFQQSPLALKPLAGKKRASQWEQFIQQQPERVKRK